MGELFNLEWTSGSMMRIEPIAVVIGTLVSWIISIVGFGIVVAPLAKNAVHGLYAAFPKFWDKVYEVKRSQLEFGGKGFVTANNGIMTAAGSNQVSKVIGTVSSVLLSLCPNIKAMTDFEDELLDAKAYFLRAIPMMCVTMFIGVFIWFGYPARVADKVGTFGRKAFDVVLDNVDPTAWVEAIPGELAIYSFATSSASDDVSEYEYKIAKSVVTTFLGSVTDTPKENRQAVASELENWVIDCCESGSYPFVDYCNSNAYKMSVDSRVSRSGAPNTDRIQGVVTDGVATFSFVKPCAEVTSSGTAMDVSNWFLQFNLTFTPIAQVNESSKYEVSATVSASSWSETDNGSTWTIQFSGDSTTGYGIQTGSTSRGYVDISGEEVAVVITASGNKLTVKATGGKSLAGVTKSIRSIQNLYYKYDGTAHNIRSITIGDGVKFSSGDVSWDWGTGPSK